MRLRDKINLFIDLLLTLVLSLIAGIGLLIKYVLPPGREKILKYGGNQDLFFLGMDRHQWGDIHLVAGYAMLVLVVLHIAFHWKIILCLAGKAVPVSWLRRSLWLIIGVACFIFLLFAFLISPEQREAGGFLHRNVHSAPVPAKVPQAPGIPEPDGEARAADRTPGSGRDHQHSDQDHSLLNGRMTLGDIARHLGIPVAEVRKRLGLPAHASSRETLGRLRRAYGLTMQEVRDRLEGKP